MLLQWNSQTAHCQLGLGLHPPNEPLWCTTCQPAVPSSAKRPTGHIWHLPRARWSRSTANSQDTTSTRHGKVLKIIGGFRCFDWANVENMEVEVSVTDCYQQENLSGNRNHHQHSKKQAPNIIQSHQTTSWNHPHHHQEHHIRRHITLAESASAYLPPKLPGRDEHLIQCLQRGAAGLRWGCVWPPVGHGPKDSHNIYPIYVGNCWNMCLLLQ